MTASSDDVRNVTAFVEGLYILPRMNDREDFFPCIHALCGSCLVEIRSRKVLKCGDVITHDCKICDLKADFTIDTIPQQTPANLSIGLLQMSIKSAETKFRCPCQKDTFSSISYCKQCRTPLCFSCKREHSGSGHEVSRLCSHVASEFPCTYHRRYLEMHCVQCNNAKCIMCYIENDKNIHAMVNSDWKGVTSEMSELTKSLNIQINLLKGDIKKAWIELTSINREIDERVRQIKNYADALGKSLKDKIKSYQEENISKLESEVKNMEEKLRATIDMKPHAHSSGSLKGIEIVEYLCRWDKIIESLNEARKCLQNDPLTSHLCFKASDTVFSEDFIGTLQDGEDNLSGEKSSEVLYKRDKNLKQEVLKQLSSTPGIQRSMNATNTFHSLTSCAIEGDGTMVGTQHLTGFCAKNQRSEDADALDKIHEAVVEMVEKYNERIKETARKLREVLSNENRSDDTFGSIVLVLEDNIMKELETKQSLCGTVTSICRRPIPSGCTLSRPAPSGPLISKIDDCAKLIYELSKMLNKVPKQSKQPSSSVGLSKDQNVTQHKKVATLVNLGNTCFMNVIVQVLFHTKAFANLLHQRNLGAAYSNTCSLTEAFVKLSSIMSGKGDIYPTDLHDALRTNLNKFSDLNQHDSHDLLIHFLNKIRREERDDLSRELKTEAEGDAFNPMKTLTAVDEVFGGHTLTVYICFQCKNPYHICEPFLDLSLPIYERNVSHSVDEKLKSLTVDRMLQPCNLYQEAIATAMKPFNGVMKETLGALENTVLSSLQHFTRLEHIHREYLCSTCNRNLPGNEPKMTSAIKQTLIYNPPAILTIHLKRFQQRYGLSGFVKNDELINFEFFFDIAPFCSSWCLNVDPNHKNIWYMLYAVIVHRGTLNSGHYEVYVMVRDDEPDMKNFLQKQFLDRDTVFSEKEMKDKIRRIENIREKFSVKPNSMSGNWYRISDGSCEVVWDLTDILRQKAYMLFYERVPTTR